MLALDFVKANRETVERAIRAKGVDLDLSALFSLDTEVRAAKTEIERLRALLHGMLRPRPAQA